MDVTPLIAEGQQIIQSYSKNGFKINGERYENAVIVTPQETTIWTDKTKLSDLNSDDFKMIYDDAKKNDVFLLGTGAEFQFPSKELLGALKDKGIKPDIMDTGAACRTYNVLMAEGRRVAALLLPI